MTVDEGTCPLLLSFCWDQTLSNSILGKKGLVSSHIRPVTAGHGSSLREVKAGTEEKRGRSLLACSGLSSSFHTARTLLRRDVLPVVGWTLLYPLTVKVVSHRHDHRTV